MLVLIKAKADWFYRPRDEKLLSVYIVNCVIVIQFVEKEIDYENE